MRVFGEPNRPHVVVRCSGTVVLLDDADSAGYMSHLLKRNTHFLLRAFWRNLCFHYSPCPQDRAE